MISMGVAAGEIVAPAVQSVFRDGEVTSILLRREARSISLTLTAVAEEYRDMIVQSAVENVSVEEWQERLRSNLADWVAESRFGWGQNRGV